MKILIVHSFYTIRGGEDNVFDQEVSLLRTGGHDVEELKVFNSVGTGGAFEFLSSIWNLKATRLISEKLVVFKPEIVHFHNLHFSLGPIVIRVCHDFGIPVVMTLHNFRLICPSATLFYKRGVYLNSLHKDFPWDAVRKGVYRNSIVQTFWLAIVTWIHKRLGTWLYVDRYIALTPFAQLLFMKSSLGFRSNQIVVKPNFVKDPLITTSSKSQYFLFVGRLSDEKGIRIMIDAFKNSEFCLRVAGDGPLRSEIQFLASTNSNFEYLGKLTSHEVTEEMSSCSALVFPSIWYEGMPMTIIEAFALGTAIISNKLGAMDSMINDGFNGLHFNGSAADLALKLKSWSLMPESEQNRIRKGSRSSYERHYTPEINLEKLNQIYISVRSEYKERKKY